MNPNMLAIVIQTTLLVCFLDFPELDSLAAVGPSACLWGTRPEDGVPEIGVPEIGVPETDVPGGATTGERGGGVGDAVELTLNGFPACLHNKHHL